MHEDFPVLTDVIDSFLNADISNIELTAAVLDLLHDYAITDSRWSENVDLAIDSIIEYNFTRMKMNTISLLESEVANVALTPLPL